MFHHITSYDVVVIYLKKYCVCLSIVKHFKRTVSFFNRSFWECGFELSVFLI